MPRISLEKREANALISGLLRMRIKNRLRPEPKPRYMRTEEKVKVESSDDEGDREKNKFWRTGNAPADLHAAEINLKDVDYKRKGRKK